MAYSNLLRVVAGIFIHPGTGEILIARRHSHVPEGGKWEFPGGKINTNETSFQALCRECDEELGCRVLEASFYHCIEEMNLSLEFWKINIFQGLPFGREGQEIRWIAVENLCHYVFPAANKMVVDKLIKSAKQD